MEKYGYFISLLGRLGCISENMDIISVSENDLDYEGEVEPFRLTR